MMFWSYDYQHVHPNGKIPRRGERLTLCLLVTTQEDQPRSYMRQPCLVMRHTHTRRISRKCEHDQQPQVDDVSDLLHLHDPSRHKHERPRRMGSWARRLLQQDHVAFQCIWPRTRKHLASSVRCLGCIQTNRACETKVCQRGLTTEASTTSSSARIPNEGTMSSYSFTSATVPPFTFDEL